MITALFQPSCLESWFLCTMGAPILVGLNFGFARRCESAIAPMKPVLKIPLEFIFSSFTVFVILNINKIIW